MKMQTKHSLRLWAGAFACLFVGLVGCGDDPGQPKADMRADEVAVDGGADALSDVGLVVESDTGVDSGTPFEFGFEAVPFEVTQEGVLPIAVTWDGTEVTGEFYFLGGLDSLAMLSFEVGGQQLSFRGVATLKFDGNCEFSLSPGFCVDAAGVDCATESATALRDELVFEIEGRHNGNQVVFSPWRVRPAVQAAHPNADLRAPVDGRLTPNNGFKPSTVPDIDGVWRGSTSISTAGSVLSGQRTCEFEVVDGRIVSMSCSDTNLVLDDDDTTAGPVTGSLRADSTLVAFEFSDDGRRSFVGEMFGAELVGVVTSINVPELINPRLIAHPAVDGMFFFRRDF